MTDPNTNDFGDHEPDICPWFMVCQKVTQKQYEQMFEPSGDLMNEGELDALKTEMERQGFREPS